MQNDLKFIKSVIYNLKRSFGGPVDIYQNIVGPTDLATGVKNITKNKWQVALAIRLPRDIHRDAIFSITGQRLFQYGNFIEVADRAIVIDWQDLPTGFAFGEQNWYVVIDNQRYEVVKVEEFDDHAAIHVILKQLSGAPAERIVDIGVTTQITTDSETTIQ